MKKDNNTSLIITTKSFKIQKNLNNTILLLVAIITLIIGLFAIIKTSYFNTIINFASEASILKYDNLVFNILSTLIIIVFLYFSYKKIIPNINIKILFIFMLIFSLSLGFWWVNYLKFKPIADQSLVIYCAEKLLDDEPKAILEPGQYLNRNPHQLRLCILFNENI